MAAVISVGSIKKVHVAAVGLEPQENMPVSSLECRLEVTIDKLLRFES